MRYRVLGPLDVQGPEGPVALSPKLRDLLATLLCHAGRPVSPGRLADVLWTGRPPGAATATLRGYVHHLRRALGPGRLASHPAGYVLHVAAGELDAAEFTAAVGRGRDAWTAGRPREAAEAFETALALWRGGTAYEEQDHLAPVHQEALRLGELRSSAVEESLDARLALGCDADLIGRLRHLVRLTPLCERPRARLALALYRTGRTAEALEVCRQGRHLLAEELGLDPGPELTALEAAILCHDPALTTHTAPGLTLSA
ncbi:AfsR/SARP family transcriptional regulator [Spirillospora sp. NPDC049652]